MDSEPRSTRIEARHDLTVLLSREGRIVISTRIRNDAHLDARFESEVVGDVNVRLIDRNELITQGAKLAIHDPPHPSIDEIVV